MNYQVITDLKEMGDFMKDLEKATEIALDTETSGLDPITCKTYSLQLFLNGKGYLFDLFKFKNLDYVLQLIENKKIVGFNLKYDGRVLEHLTGRVFRNIFDIQTVEVQLSLGTGDMYPSLEEVTFKYLNVKLDKEVRKTFYEAGELKELTQQQIIYALEDVMYLFPIKELQIQHLKDSKQLRVIEEVESPFTSVLVRAENEGVTIDTDKWKALTQEAKERLEVLTDEWYDNLITRLTNYNFSNLLDLADRLSITDGNKTKRDRSALEQITDSAYYSNFIRNHFNIGSTYQLQSALRLFGVKDEEGKSVVSTNEKVIRSLDIHDEMLDKLFDIREQAKLISTYGETFLENIHPTTGKIHPNYNQIGTRTGRMSCDKPNLQNIPIRTEFGRQYRYCFIAPEGYDFINFDYSQQEYRLAGAVTGDPVIIQAYLDGFDMHSKTASIVFGYKMEEVPKEKRQIAKNMNFAIIYGSTANGLAYNFKMGYNEAEDLIRLFKKTYPTFYKFKEHYEEQVVKRMFATTLTGRRRYFEEKVSFDTPWDYKRYIRNIRREGFNVIIQGTAADVVKIAMTEIDMNNPFKPDELKPVMQIHDEVVEKSLKRISEDAFKFCIETAEKVEQRFLGPIPAKAEGKISSTWEH